MQGIFLCDLFLIKITVQNEIYRISKKSREMRRYNEENQNEMSIKKTYEEI